MTMIDVFTRMLVYIFRPVFMDYEANLLCAKLFGTVPAVVSLLATFGAFSVKPRKDGKRVRLLQWMLILFFRCGFGMLSVLNILTAFTDIFDQPAVSYYEDYVYYGQSSNSQPDGFGRYYDEDKQLRYIGYFENGYRSGQGEYYKSYLDLYKNAVEERLRREQGEDLDERELKWETDDLIRLLNESFGYENEDVYLNVSGEFSWNYAHGRATEYRYSLYDLTEEQRQADWYIPVRGENGEVIPEGEKRVYLSGKYEGEWKQGYWDGEGVYEYYDVTGKVLERYTGMFREGCYEGKGVLEYWYTREDGQVPIVFTGCWDGGKISGEGAYYWEDGSLYMAGWTDGEGMFHEDPSVSGRWPFPGITISEE